ncbi:hypothetical protein TGMAS_246450B, partial [Toxoplasma gondii MAS]
PYVSVVLLSYIWVVRVGGTGTEMKSFFELQEEQDKAATATAERSGAKDRDEEATARVEASEKKPLLENAEPTIEVDSP